MNESHVRKLDTDKDGARKLFGFVTLSGIENISINNKECAAYPQYFPPIYRF